MNAQQTRSETVHEAGPERRSPRASLLDLVAVAVPPAVWFVQLNLSYVLVPPSCRAGHRWFLASVTVVALVAMVPSARRFARARRDPVRDGLGAFLGSVGVWLTAFFAVVTVLVGASALVIGPCR